MLRPPPRLYLASEKSESAVILGPAISSPAGAVRTDCSALGVSYSASSHTKLEEILASIGPILKTELDQKAEEYKSTLQHM